MDSMRQCLHTAGPPSIVLRMSVLRSPLTGMPLALGGVLLNYSGHTIFCRDGVYMGGLNFWGSKSSLRAYHEWRERGVGHVHGCEFAIHSRRGMRRSLSGFLGFTLMPRRVMYGADGGQSSQAPKHCVMDYVAYERRCGALQSRGAHSIRSVAMHGKRAFLSGTWMERVPCLSCIESGQALTG